MCYGIKVLQPHPEFVCKGLMTRVCNSNLLLQPRHLIFESLSHVNIVMLFLAYGRHQSSGRGDATWLQALLLYSKPLLSDHYQCANLLKH
jgi:hypothetical protein